jgi:hypothetical protein
MPLWTLTDGEEKPTFVKESEADSVFGVDINEARDSANIAKGINTPGWVKYSTYTDANGNVRHKSEVLIVTKNISGDNDTLPAPTVSITSQPSVSVADPLTFSVGAASTGGAQISYQWQKAEAEAATSFSDIDGANSATYEVGTVEAEDLGDVYRVVVSGSNGAGSITSSTIVVE